MQKENKTQIKGSWTTIFRQANFPTKRWGHTAITYKNFIYIYGGTDYRDQKCFFYQFNCDTQECIAFQFSDLIDERESHSCCLINNHLLVYGGCHKQDFAASLLSISLQTHSPFILKQKQPYLLRQSHVAVMLNNRFMLVYGGTNQFQQDRDDFWLLQLENLKWFEIKKKSGTLPPKVGCSLVSIKDAFYIYGGELKEDFYNGEVYKLSFPNLNLKQAQDLEEIKIEQMNVRGKKPEARSCHACVVYKNEYMVMLGGEGSKKSFNDVWLFDSRAALWTQVFISPENCIKGRSNFAATVYKDKIYVFGGFIQLKQKSKKKSKALDQFLILEINQFSPEMFQSSSNHSIVPSLDYPMPQLNDSVMNNSPQMCSVCLLQYCPSNIEPLPPLKLVPNYCYLNASFSTLQKTAAQISNPFDAFGLIRACSYQLNSSLYISMKQTHSHYEQILYPLSNQHSTSQMEVPGYYFRKATINTSFNLLFHFPQIQLTEDEFKIIVYSYKYRRFEFEMDWSIPVQSMFHPSEQSFQCIGFNFKNALFRLGSEVLLQYTNQNQTYCALISTFGIHFARISDKNIDAPTLIINKYISDYSISHCGFGLSAHVSSLKKAQNHPQLSLVGTDIINKLNDDASLLKYFYRYYLDPFFRLSLYIQNKVVQTLDQTKLLPLNMQIEHEYFHTNKLMLNEGAPEPILVYHNNRYIGMVKKYTNVKGYVQLKLLCELNLTSTKVNDPAQLIKAMDKLVNSFLTLACKRLQPVESQTVSNKLRIIDDD